MECYRKKKNKKKKQSTRCHDANTCLRLREARDFGFISFVIESKSAVYVGNNF